MVFKLIFRPLDVLFNTGKLMLCADGQMRQCYPVICAWTADYFENIHLHSIKQPHCPVCEAPKSSFGEGNSSSWLLRDYRLYFQRMILATQGDEMDMLRGCFTQSNHTSMKVLILNISTIKYFQVCTGARP